MNINKTARQAKILNEKKLGEKQNEKRKCYFKQSKLK